jgi:hypothetical protein
MDREKVSARAHTHTYVKNRYQIEFFSLDFSKIDTTRSPCFAVVIGVTMSRRV